MDNQNTLLETTLPEQMTVDCMAIALNFSSPYFKFRNLSIS